MLVSAPKRKRCLVLRPQREPEEENREIRRRRAAAEDRRRDAASAAARSSNPRRKIAYSEILALPKVEDIKTNGRRLLLVLSPDKKMPPEDAERLFKAVVEKNNFCIVTGDGSDLAKLEDKVRRIWAVAKVKDEDGGDKSPNVAELNEEAEQAEFEFNSTLTSAVQPNLLPRTASRRKATGCCRSP